jgi:hypothetical protein
LFRDIGSTALPRASKAGSPAARSARAGLHLYTFDDIERTERWRRQAIARLATAA